MEQITARTLRNIEWSPVYTYTSRPGGYAFTTYASDAVPGLTITKEQRGRRVNTIYKFNGRKTDSPTQAVRYYNEEVKKRKGFGQPPAGSPKSSGRPEPRKGTGL